MKLEDIYSELEPIFRTTFKDPDITLRPDMDADDIDEWDSLTHIHLILEVERKFQLKFRNSEVARLENVNDLVNLIAKHAPSRDSAN